MERTQGKQTGFCPHQINTKSEAALRLVLPDLLPLRVEKIPDVDPPIVGGRSEILALGTQSNSPDFTGLLLRSGRIDLAVGLPLRLWGLVGRNFPDLDFAAESDAHSTLGVETCREVVAAEFVGGFECLD